MASRVPEVDSRAAPSAIELGANQLAFYVNVKQEFARRFRAVYDEVCRDDILAHAYARWRATGAAPVADGETCTTASPAYRVSG